jgi:glucose dehydrogenase
MNRLIALVGVLAVAVLGYLAVTNETASPDPQDQAQMSEASSTVKPTLGFIDDARIKNAESEPGNWLSFGRTYEEQRHSPLTQINRESIEGLGLAWYKDMGTNADCGRRHYVFHQFLEPCVCH